MNEDAVETKDITADRLTSPSNKSVPDRIFINKDGKVFFIEFKSERGKLTKLQSHTIELMKNHNTKVFIVNDKEKGKQLIESLI